MHCFKLMIISAAVFIKLFSSFYEIRPFSGSRIFFYPVAGADAHNLRGHLLQPRLSSPLCIPVANANAVTLLANTLTLNTNCNRTQF